MRSVRLRPLWALFLIVALFLAQLSHASESEIAGYYYWFAGRGATDVVGRKADSVQLNSSGLAVGPDRAIYFSDYYRILRINPASQIIELVAGTGQYTSQTGDGPALETNLTAYSLAFDSVGNLYFRDLYYLSLRRLTVAGNIESLSKEYLSVPAPIVTQDGSFDVGIVGGEWGVAVDGNDDVYYTVPNYASAGGDDLVKKFDHLSGEISTIAGGGVSRLDGTPALAASFHAYEIAVDGPGNIYVSEDGWNHMIKKIDTAGRVTTLAGTGKFGFSGDGGPANEAQLAYPTDILPMDDGSVLITDSYNSRIRRVDPNGNISTFAGTGAYGYSGDGGPATSAALWGPTLMAKSPGGGVYFIDSTNRVFREILSGTIQTVAGRAKKDQGDGGPALEASVVPGGIAVDDQGRVVISDPSSHRIRRVDSDGIISTIAGTGEQGFSGDGGPALSAKLNMPDSVVVAPDGSIYFTQIADSRIRRIDPNGTITTVAGNGEYGYSGDGGPAIDAQLRFPKGLDVDGSGTVYVADTQNFRVRRIDPAGTITTIAGTGTAGFSGDGGPATEARFRTIYDVVVAQDGSVLIADSGNGRIRRMGPNGILTTIAGKGRAARYSEFKGTGGPATEAEFDFLTSIDIGSDGRIFLVDLGGNSRLHVIGADGRIFTAAGGPGGYGSWSHEGRPAREMYMGLMLRSVAVDQDGTAYLGHADSSYNPTFGWVSRVKGPIPGIRSEPRTDTANFSLLGPDAGHTCSNAYVDERTYYELMNATCFRTQDDDQAIARLELTDETGRPLAGEYRWGYPGDYLGFERNFCGTVRNVEAPAYATFIHVSQRVPSQDEAGCGVSRTGSATVAFW